MFEESLLPRYQKIALDIANAIYKGNIKEGQKLHGRSTLAGKYNVSPETIRRAIKLLEDVEVVESSRGSGITVLSKENAFVYINKFQNIESIGYHKKRIIALTNQKKEIDQQIMESIGKIIDYSGTLSNISPITPLEIEIPAGSKIIGESIEDVKFWQYTGSTIVGIKRKGEIILSPGPYATFEEEDILVVIGAPEVYDAVRLFLNEE
ncbi:MAG TPA: GntR family transcriptional regulator [Epulopiscium sp.]|nr:GntR family transcriptional regulator [Candidatus Epulonipiscium sp.]